MIDQQQGSDDLMTDEQRAAIRAQAEIELAAALEEDRKTAAQPTEAPGEAP